MDMSATENLTITTLAEYWKFLTIHTKLETKEAVHWFQKLSVQPSWGFSEPLSSFSGGNQQKLLLAKWLRLSPKVMLLEEPTQGVDVSAKAEIHRQLFEASRAGSALLISSADVDELIALCSRVLVMRGGRMVASLTGTDLTVASITRESLMARRSFIEGTVSIGDRGD